MQTKSRMSLFAGLLLLSAPATQNRALPVGHWEGAIQTPGAEVRVAVDFAKNDRGELIGAFSNPARGITGFPLSALTVDGRTVRFQLDVAGGGAFQCRIAPDKKTMTGRFTMTTARGDTSLAFTLSRTGDARIEAPPKSPAIGQEMVGAWEGTIEADGRTMRVRLELENRADGTSAGTVANLDQGGARIPVTTIVQKESTLTVDIKTVGGSYSGTLGEIGELAGAWSQGGMTLPLVFRRVVPTTDSK